MEEIDGGRELARRMGESSPIVVAFWVRESETGSWYLYLAAERFDDEHLARGYGEVLRVAKELNSPYLDPFSVKLISADNPLARAALEIHQRHPGDAATRFGGRSFGGLGVEDVYIYPARFASLTT